MGSFLFAFLLCSQDIRRLSICRAKKGTADTPLTTHQASELHRRRVTLCKRTNYLRGMQSAYMPGAAIKVREAAVSLSGAADVEDEVLWLPSDFMVQERVQGCADGLAALEVEHRVSQLRDALEEVRSSQQLIQRYYAHRKKHVRGQHALTRSMSFVEQEEDRCTQARERYTFCRAALAKLKGDDVTWMEEFKELRVEHCIDLQGAEYDIDILLPLGQGTYVMSWIWTVPGALEDGSSTQLMGNTKIE